MRSLIMVVLLSINAIASSADKPYDPVYPKKDKNHIAFYYANGTNGYQEKKIYERWVRYLRQKLDIDVKKDPRYSARLAYNSSKNENRFEGEWDWDFLEAARQRFCSIRFVGDTICFLRKMALKETLQFEVSKEMLKEISREPEYSDLRKQWLKYQEDLNLGHTVVVFAHSQGNLFTNIIYDHLEEWQKPYFHVVAIGSPANRVAGGGPRISLEGDVVSIYSMVSQKRIQHENFSKMKLEPHKIHALPYYFGYNMRLKGKDEPLSTTNALEVMKKHLKNIMNKP